ncbi:MAG: ParB/RepB/Spo0J family partition protein [Acidimicrobiales bacterium]
MSFSEVKVDTAVLARRLAASDALSKRRFETLPLTGPGAPQAEAQGRQHGDSTTDEGLVELISSISTVGVLQPILVEEMDDGRRRVVAGERRLRACRRGSVLEPDSPHFRSIPAVVCPGPLSEEERRTWQLVENLARTELQPAELAAALVFERCALLATKLDDAGVVVPDDVKKMDEPIARWRALDRVRAYSDAPTLAAPWPEVLRRIGIQVGPEKARQLVRAFAALPPELSEEMDDAKVTLASRLAFLRLSRGRKDAASELWEAVRERQATGLLSGAVAEVMAHPDLAPGEALDRATQRRDDANEARSRALSSTPPPAAPLDAEIVSRALAGIREIAAAIRAGRALGRYDAGSLRLLATEILAALPTEEKSELPKAKAKAQPKTTNAKVTKAKPVKARPRAKAELAAQG